MLGCCLECKHISGTLDWPTILRGCKYSLVTSGLAGPHKPSLHYYPFRILFGKTTGMAHSCSKTRPHGIFKRWIIQLPQHAEASLYMPSSAAYYPLKNI